jgi:hypothetical protein
VSQDRPEDFELLLQASLENLARLPITPERSESEPPFFLLDGHFFAASKILDKRLLRDLAARLGCEVLMIAVPGTQTALIAPLLEQDQIASFIQMVEEIHREHTQESYRLSELVFIATPANGIEGLVRLSTATGEQ